jgi:hypothetical protein
MGLRGRCRCEENHVEELRQELETAKEKFLDEAEAIIRAFVIASGVALDPREREALNRANRWLLKYRETRP